MRILLTNDDGFDAPGLQALITAFSADHEVWVVAPDQDRSGVSNSFTMNKPLCLKKQQERMYTCSGTPADCTAVGTQAVLKKMPDVLIAGINRGANLGTDIVYSGTAAAARQATLYGIPGIALSLESKIKKWNYEPLARFAAENLEKLISLCNADIFVNINALDADFYSGYKMTLPARRNYQDSMELLHAPDDSLYSFFKGGIIKTEGEDGTDFAAVQEGFISISRILAQPCAAEDTAALPHLLSSAFVI